MNTPRATATTARVSPACQDLDGIDDVGEDHVLWGNDYPHYEGTFPYNLESLRLTFGDIPEAGGARFLA